MAAEGPTQWCASKCLTPNIIGGEKKAIDLKFVVIINFCSMNTTTIVNKSHQHHGDCFTNYLKI